MKPSIGPAFEPLFGESPVVLIDVGARGGIQEVWKPASPHLRVIGFEPDPDECARLSEAAPPGTTYICAALADAPGRLSLNLTRAPGSSSVLEPNRGFLDPFPESERFDVVRRLEIDASTLDHELAEAGVSDADFLKVDTQGSELSILAGAEHTVRDRLLGVEVEVEFSEMYVGQPLFADIDMHLRERGFQLFDIRPHRWKRECGIRFGGPRGQLVFGEALYLRDEPGLVQLLEGLESRSAKRSKVAKALFVSIAYGYLDYACEIVETAGEYLSAEERQEFERACARSVAASTRLPAFRGRGRIAGLFHAAYRFFDHPLRGWATSGGQLGNR